MCLFRAACSSFVLYVVFPNFLYLFVVLSFRRSYVLSTCLSFRVYVFR